MTNESISHIVHCQNKTLLHGYILKEHTFNAKTTTTQARSHGRIYVHSMHIISQKPFYKRKKENIYVFFFIISLVIRRL